MKREQPRSASRNEGPVCQVVEISPGYVVGRRFGPSPLLRSVVVNSALNKGAVVKLRSWARPAGARGIAVMRALAVAVVLSTFSYVAGPGASVAAAADQTTGWAGPTQIDPGPLGTISCASGSFCAAVDGSGDLVRFNGSTWTTPTRIGNGDGPLGSMSCPTSTFCAAVDGEGKVVTFNGSTWTTPTQIGNGNGDFQSVSCPTSTFCAAVGWVATGSYAATFNGSSWTTPVQIDSTGSMRPRSTAALGPQPPPSTQSGDSLVVTLSQCPVPRARSVPRSDTPGTS
jgi:hypothetical protein